MATQKVISSMLDKPICTHNFIHNGDMRIAQRSTSVSSITGVGYQTIDNYYLQLNTSHGYIQIGPGNTSYAHIQTDRPQFYFNKKLVVNN